MRKYKINSLSDNRVFIITESFKKICNRFKNLKNSRGKIIHVIGAPGTGKSANIYAAIDDLGLDIYDVKSTIEDINISSEELFDGVYKEFKREIGADSKKEIFEGLSKFDAVLFADSFHDSHINGDGTVGFSVWTGHAGFKAIKFYLLCITEYLTDRQAFKGINIILQTAWRIDFNGKKYDIFSDLGIISMLCAALLRIFFEVVVISYSSEETIKIVKNHINANEKLIQHYIDRYGSKPRYICQALEMEEI